MSCHWCGAPATTKRLITTGYRPKWGGGLKQKNEPKPMCARCARQYDRMSVFGIGIIGLLLLGAWIPFLWPVYIVVGIVWAIYHYNKRE
jgi:hypothetical protein